MRFVQIALLFILGFKWSCDRQNNHKQQDKPIAWAKGQYLYQQDLANMQVELANPQDSTELMNRYVQSWVAKQVLIAKAEAQSDYHKADIERKLLDYKYALIVHSYVEKLVNTRLDKYISEEEITHYYQAYQENFALKHPIIKGKFVSIPKNTPNKNQLRKLLMSKKEEDQHALKAYCSQFAKDFSLDDTVWLNWHEMIGQTPFAKIKNQTRLLQKANLTEIQDEAYHFYLKIDAYKWIGDPAPIELVQNQIKDVMLYKRKLALTNQIKEEILQQAKADNEYKIYNN